MYHQFSFFFFPFSFFSFLFPILFPVFPFLFFCFLFPFFSPYRNRGDDDGRSLAGGAGFGGGVLLGVDGGAAARWPGRSEAATADLWPLALPGGGGPVCLLHGGEGRGRHFLAGLPAATCSMAGAAGRREPPPAAAAGLSVNYFEHLFTADELVNPQEIVDLLEPSLSAQTNSDLCKEYSDEEIGDALF